MVKENKFTVKGKVIQHNKEKFIVEVQTEKEPQHIESYISGKLKINKIRIVVGDDVLVEVDCYNLKGRILKRLK